MDWRKKVNAWRVFFPLAAVYGLIALPLSVYSLTTGHAVLAGLQTPLGHAHELLFGYTLAVATGFLLNRVPAWWVAGLLVLWLCARGGFLIAPGSLFSDIFNILFATGFIVTGASRFLPTAKKWRNKVFGLTVIVLGALAVLSHGMIVDAPIALAYAATHEAVVIFSLLMLLMGGRFIAPAAAGHIEKRGGTLEARVQPRLEGALIILLVGAAISFLAGFDLLTGILLAACGCVALVRLIRWRLWLCLDRMDLISLGVGYLWLSAGLVMTGISLALSGEMRVAFHAITVGAIGTLTLTVMSRIWMQRSGVSPAKSMVLGLMLPLVAIAALLRIGSGLVPPEPAVTMQAGAALAWCSAFLVIIFGVFLRYPGTKNVLG